MPEPVPLRDKVRLEVLPQQERSSVLVTVARETPVRRCKVLALGPDAPKDYAGKTVLANILSGQYFGDDLILPHQSIIAVLED